MSAEPSGPDGLMWNGDTGSPPTRPAAKTMIIQPQTIQELMLCMSSFFFCQPSACLKSNRHWHLCWRCPGKASSRSPLCAASQAKDSLTDSTDIVLIRAICVIIVIRDPSVIVSSTPPPLAASLMSLADRPDCSGRWRAWRSRSGAAARQSVPHSGRPGDIRWSGWRSTAGPAG